MRLITVDDEGVDLLEAAAEMAHAALDARARRVDPDGLISTSVGMSRIKTADVLKQLRMPPLGRFTDLPIKERHACENICNLMLAAETDDQKNELFDQLRVYTLRRSFKRTDKEASPIKT